MQMHIPLAQNLSLTITMPASGRIPYATSRLQRGLLLLDGDAQLSEEAVGFGVPVLKRGLQAIFPGGAQFTVEQTGPRMLVRANFKLNRVERLTGPKQGNVGSPWFYALKDLLAATIRHLPATRAPLTATSSWLRQVFGLETSYVDAGFETEVAVTYGIDGPAGKIRFEVDCSSLPPDVSEVVLMHEQGAHIFDRYQDSSGLNLQGDEIGCWDEVRAAEAWFESSSHRLAFRLRMVEGAQLFRGRELIGSRLAWAGFGYSFPPALRGMHHEIGIFRIA
jgi:hypothetical protein